MTTRLTELETELRAAILLDNTETATEDNKDKDKRELTDKLQLGRYLSAALTEERISDGPEAEFAQEEKLEGFQVPWEAIAPRETEKRADAHTAAPSEVGQEQDPILRRVFAKGAEMWCGVRFPSVGIGEKQFPVLSAGNTPALIAKDSPHDSTAATWVVKVVKPKRMTARYTFAIEDAAVFQGMEAALRDDLSGAISEEMDKEILAGDGTGQHVSGFFDTSSGPLTVPADLSAESGRSEYIDAIASSVDWRYALENGDVKLLIGSATNAHMSSKFGGTNSDSTAAEHVKRISGGARVSAHVPAVASSIQLALACRKMGSTVAPVWKAVSLVRDPYTDAASGLVALTAHVLWEFDIPRSNVWKLLKFQVEG